MALDGGAQSIARYETRTVRRDSLVYARRRDWPGATRAPRKVIEKLRSARPPARLGVDRRAVTSRRPSSGGARAEKSVALASPVSDTSTPS